MAWSSFFLLSLREIERISIQTILEIQSLDPLSSSNNIIVCPEWWGEGESVWCVLVYIWWWNIHWDLTVLYQCFHPFLRFTWVLSSFFPTIHYHLIILLLHPNRSWIMMMMRANTTITGSGCRGSSLSSVVSHSTHNKEKKRRKATETSYLSIESFQVLFWTSGRSD